MTLITVILKNIVLFELLNVYDRILECIPRTTNLLEGWKRNIKKVVRVTSPNIVN